MYDTLSLPPLQAQPARHAVISKIVKLLACVTKLQLILMKSKALAFVGIAALTRHVAAD
ncbi:MAG: hypothetical protein V4661_04875 [Pseudomonadota bacterium]